MKGGASQTGYLGMLAQPLQAGAATLNPRHTLEAAPWRELVPEVVETEPRPPRLSHRPRPDSIATGEPSPTTVSARRDRRESPPNFNITPAADPAVERHQATAGRIARPEVHPLPGPRPPMAAESPSVEVQANREAALAGAAQTEKSAEPRFLSSPASAAVEQTRALVVESVVRAPRQTGPSLAPPATIQDPAESRNAGARKADASTQAVMRAVTQRGAERRQPAAREQAEAGSLVASAASTKETRSKDRPAARVHIGTLEIRMSAPAQAAQPPKREQSFAPHPPATAPEPLARELAWTYGLAQG